ncbi:MAG: NAD(P)-dependent oxidoreductase [Geminicoccaceae bacterium]|nr:NAD(P)-dependent oxidoreductase [Geminicoccaceae bacterium]MCB9942409.1 NAD(P)-dependent oxidoreductase [Geminicoccaceae bacterium]
MAADLGQREIDIRAGRLDSADYAENFDDLHPPLDGHEAKVEADRCYYCYDAPCMQACPTHIDIPLFIRQIATGNPAGSARTILTSNILGGMCARVCPTETLCEEVCVREVNEGKPVRIGELQRYATDHLTDRDNHPFERAASTGRRVAVVGAGPAGLSCAHRLAMLGHDVTLYDARDKPGGLNEFGIARYKSTGDFAQREVRFVLGIGGITLRTGQRLGDDFTLDRLKADHDAVFLGLGLGSVNALGIDGEDLDGVLDAVRYIADLRQAADPATLPVGRHVVVVGGGMTAIDIAVQTRLLGAEQVTIVYRRGQERMNASVFEQDLAQTHGVTIRTHAGPVRAIGGSDGRLRAVEFEYMSENEDGRLCGTGERFTLPADQLFKAIGQSFASAEGLSLATNGGRITVDSERRTSDSHIWAGGDCVDGGEDLTVTAVEDGKIAALSIHRMLTGA